MVTGVYWEMLFEVPEWKLSEPAREEVTKGKSKKRQHEASDSLSKTRPKPVIQATRTELPNRIADKASRRKVTSPSAPSTTSKQPVRQVTKQLGLSTKDLPPSSKQATISASDKLRAKLSGSRFRLLNQRLYESSSLEAFQYFQEHPDDFSQYHLGFREQTRSWPINPLDVLIERLDGKCKREMERRRNGTFSIQVADLGCGEARLAQTLSARYAKAPSAQSTPIRFHSFDLVAINEHITVASMTNVPLPDKSVHYAIFCLSLMNVDFASALCEASRILLPSGQLWIAEISSRFEGAERGIANFIEYVRSLGFRLDKQESLHDYFVMFFFTKTDMEMPTSAKRSKPPTLKACMYKRR